MGQACAVYPSDEVKTKLQSNETRNVYDLVASGRLLASIVDIHEKHGLVPRMPLLLLIGWANNEMDDIIESDDDSEKRLADAVMNLVYASIDETWSGNRYESVCIARHELMRYVYKEIMDDVLRTTRATFIKADWRNATLLDIYSPVSHSKR